MSMYAICDCYCRRCLLHDDCGGCAHVDDEAAFLAVHPVVDDDDIETLATKRAGRGE